MRTGLAAGILFSAVAVFSVSAVAQSAQNTTSGTTQFRQSRVINTVSPPKPALYIPPLRPVMTPPSVAVPPAPPAVVAPANPMPPMANAPTPSEIKAAKPDAPAIVNAPAAAITNTPLPTPPAEPQGRISVSLKDSLLSVLIENMTLSRAIETIGKEAEFEVKLYGDIPETLISTEFKDMDVERAVARVMSLAGQKDYFFYYDTKGAITLLETYGASGIKTQPNTQVKKSTPSQSPRSTRATVTRRQVIPQPPVDANDPALADEPAYNDQFDDDIYDEGEPSYIPPARRR